MTQAVLPEGLQSIGKSAFTTCLKLQSVTIPSSLRTVSIGAFNYCSKLQTVFAANLEHWCSIAFEGIWANPCSFGASLYMGQELLQELVIPEGVETVGEFQFYGCGSLVSADFSESVHTIGKQSFVQAAVQRVTIPSIVKEVQYNAFASCTSLKELTIHEGVQSLGQYAFYGCTSLKSVSLPDSLQALESYCFQNCKALEQVCFPKGLTEIPAYAFNNCYALNHVTLPETIESIGICAFYACESLERIVFPESVKTIGYNGFGACDVLELAIFLNPETLPHDHRGTFDSNTTLHGAADSGAEYYATKYDIPFSAHEYAVTDTQEVSCVQDGVVTHSCTICPHKYYDTTPLTGHAYSYSIENGIASLACANCGDSAQIAPTPFVDGATADIDVYGGYVFYSFAPDFTEHHALRFSGNAVSTATLHALNCEVLTQKTGSSYSMSAELTQRETYIIALRLNTPTQLGSVNISVQANHTCTPHLTTEPTCTEDGEWTYACDCGYFYTLPAVAIGHSYVPVETAPTCTEGGYTTYTCTVCGESYTADETAAYCPSAHLLDVAGPSDWTHKGIDYAVKHGLFSGMSATTFEPETAMTRAMLVTVLWRYAGKPIEGKNAFVDVPNGQWYTDAVTWAAYNGIVAGVGNGKFDPEGKITREQMAAILYRYAGKVGIDTSKRVPLSTFPDAGKVSTYAKDALQWAVAEGLVSGSREGSVTYLHPQGNATRAQVASILMRFIENVAT